MIDNNSNISCGNSQLEAESPDFSILKKVSDENYT